MATTDAATIGVVAGAIAADGGRKTTGADMRGVPVGRDMGVSIGVEGFRSGRAVTPIKAADTAKAIVAMPSVAVNDQRRRCGVDPDIWIETMAAPVRGHAGRPNSFSISEVTGRLSNMGCYREG